MCNSRCSVLVRTRPDPELPHTAGSLVGNPLYGRHMCLRKHHAAIAPLGLSRKQRSFYHRVMTSGESVDNYSRLLLRFKAWLDGLRPEVLKQSDDALLHAFLCSIASTLKQSTAATYFQQLRFVKASRIDEAIQAVSGKNFARGIQRLKAENPTQKHLQSAWPNAREISVPTLPRAGERPVDRYLRAFWFCLIATGARPENLYRAVRVQLSEDGKHLLVTWGRRKGKRVVTVPLAYPFAWSTRPCQDVIDTLRELEKRSVESGRLEWGFTTAFPARRILDFIRPLCGAGWSSTTGRRRMSCVLVRRVQRGLMPESDYELYLDHKYSQGLAAYAMSRIARAQTRGEGKATSQKEKTPAKASPKKASPKKAASKRNTPDKGSSGKKPSRGKTSSRKTHQDDDDGSSSDDGDEEEEFQDDAPSDEEDEEDDEEDEEEVEAAVPPARKAKKKIPSGKDRDAAAAEAEKNVAAAAAEKKRQEVQRVKEERREALRAELAALEDDEEVAKQGGTDKKADAKPKKESGAAGSKDLARRDQDPSDAKKRRPRAEAATTSRIGEAASSRSTKKAAKKAESSSDSDDSPDEEESDDEEEEEEDDSDELDSLTAQTQDVRNALRSLMSSAKAGKKAGKKTTRK
jgi:hypothetical protein